MLRDLEQAFCAPTFLCLGADEDAAAAAVASEMYHEPLASSTIDNAVIEDGSSYSEQAQYKSYWNPDFAQSPCDQIPSVVRVSSLTAASPVFREQAKEESTNLPPSSSEVYLPETTSSQFRLSQRRLTDASRPWSPSLTIKKANPVTKDETTDEETVSTQSSHSSSFSLTVENPASSSSSPEQRRGLTWAKSSSKFLLRPPQRASEPMWIDSVIEETAEGFRIHGPPELVLSPIREGRRDCLFETPKPPRKKNGLINKTKFQLKPRASKVSSDLYLPRLD